MRSFNRSMAIPAIHAKLTSVEFVGIINWLIRTITYVCKFRRTKISKKENNRPESSST